MNSTRETFIVRLWHEGSNQSDWKGEILHVKTGKTVHIQGVIGLNQFFNEYFSEVVPQSYGLK
jgi:hypothetical protein